KRIMSCFDCCEEDNYAKSVENGRQYVLKISTGNNGNYHSFEIAKPQTVKVHPIEVPAILPYRQMN
ncbi:hypothetical protein HN51_036165, partial [Arachis hypogaea]